jgi:hypothetical protein
MYVALACGRGVDMKLTKAKAVQLAAGLAVMGAVIFGAHTSEAHCVPGSIHMYGWQHWTDISTGEQYDGSGCVYVGTVQESWNSYCMEPNENGECSYWDIWHYYNCDGCQDWY